MIGRAIASAAALALAGCVTGPKYVAVADRPSIDRTEVEYPNDLTFTPFINGLTAPTAIGFEQDDPAYKDCCVVVESGLGTLTGEPRILGYRPDGQPFNIYPRYTRIPLLDESFHIYGPVTGMALKGGKIYVAHRDAQGNGVITALDYNGGHETVIANIPSIGDYGLTDVAIHPTNGRLYFGVGSVTNSGVVGLDDWAVGWVGDHPDVSDQPYAPTTDFKLAGARFITKNPRAGWFSGDTLAVTAPFQAFGSSLRLRVSADPGRRPTSAIYSVDLGGGALRVDAHGIRNPRGLVFNEIGNLFASNDGMEQRGSRPVKDDPDVVVRVVLGGEVWYGFPDFSADLHPITDPKYQLSADQLKNFDYPELAPLIDHDASGLSAPEQLLVATFQPQSGAAKMTFVPDEPIEAFKRFRGKLIVALSGDHAPFATGGQPLPSPRGFMVRMVDPETQKSGDFIVNSRRVPASQVPWADYELERPIDVKFGPDGALYVVDYGRMDLKNGRERVTGGTGRVYRLGPPAVPTTGPTSTPEKARNYQNG